MSRNLQRQIRRDQKAGVVPPPPWRAPIPSYRSAEWHSAKSLPKEDLYLKSCINKIIGLTDELLYYVHEVGKRSQEPDTAPSLVADILDELDRVNYKHASALGSKHCTYARGLPRARGYEKHPEGCECNFLALSIRPIWSGRYVLPSS